MHRLLVTIPVAFVLLAGPRAAPPAMAAPPGEVTGVTVDPSSNLAWSPVAGSDDYNVYRGRISWLRTGDGAECHGDEIAVTSFPTAADPPAGDAFFYLVTAESNIDGEGTAGTTSAGGPRPLRGSCDRIMRHHLSDRIGFGWDEWTRDRLALLGPAAYLGEQLDPASISEATNTELSTRRAPLVPPESNQELVALDVVNAVYSRRQLEQQATLFWDNHFNTDYRETFQFFNFYNALFPATQALEAAGAHHDAQNDFRNLAFNGTFRDLVEASALGPAMILYLDTDSNVKAAPNENFARELLELHALGVDGGYTQEDIVQLSRVFTGWNVCKKSAAVAGDPLAACIPASTYGTAGEPPGLWVANFRINQHDTGQKVLFAGTPQEVIIPSTASIPANGVNDAQIALDAIVAHPSTPRFITTKLLQKFVDESPTQAMVDSVVTAWNNPGNPLGAGDLRAVLAAVLEQARLMNPDRVGTKLKTPFEHVVSAFRAVRGRTDGLNLSRTYLQRMQEVFHNNAVPTGYSEIGADWLDTNNLLERQNFGLDMTSRTANNFGADVIGLLNANGVPTAPAPNNAAAIVDFLVEAMFGGALTSAERQAAIDYLNTDDNGIVSSYNDVRIREAAGVLLGYAQFIEQ